MKLSEKGIKSFEKQVIDIALSDPETYNKDKAIRHIDFQPEHFDSGMVWLTVEEAQDIFAIIEDCVSLDVIRMYKDLICDFQKRIEQAENVNV